MERLAGSYYQYTGSHLYIPCANANWIVFEEPITVSDMQLSKLRLVILAISKVLRFKLTFNSKYPMIFYLVLKKDI